MVTSWGPFYKVQNRAYTWHGWNMGGVALSTVGEAPPPFCKAHQS